MLAHDRGFAGIEAEDEIAVGDGFELVEQVEQQKRVVRLLIEAIVLEGALEGTAGAGLITGPQQVLAEIRMRLRVRIVKGQRAAHLFDGLIEAVVASEVIASDAVHLAVDRVDLQNLLDL